MQHYTANKNLRTSIRSTKEYKRWSIIADNEVVTGQGTNCKRRTASSVNRCTPAETLHSLETDENIIFHNKFSKFC